MLGIGIGLSNRNGGAADLVRARPTTGAVIWTGYPPTTSGITRYANPVVGAATWTGYPPTISIALVAAPAVGAATWTGPAPTVTGLVPDGAVVDRSGNQVLARDGAYVDGVR